MLFTLNYQNQTTACQSRLVFFETVVEARSHLRRDHTSRDALQRRRANEILLTQQNRQTHIYIIIIIVHL